MRAGRFWDGNVPGNQIRRETYMDRSAYTWDAAVADLPRKYEEYFFSEVDQLTATPLGSDHDHNPSTDNVFKFRLSGEAPHSYSHNGDFSVTHGHDNSRMANITVVVSPR